MVRGVVLSIVLGLAISAFAEITDDEGVLVLDKANFEDALKEHKNILVEFYAPWCGHCKALAPEYVKVAKKLKDEGSELRVAKVDATVQTELAERFKISGFPTLKFFKSGEPMDYNGGRKADEILGWMKKRSGPPTTLLSDGAAIETFVDSAEVVVIAFLDKENEEIQKKLENAATSVSEVPFGVAIGSSIAADYKVAAGSNKLVVFKKFDEKRADYSEDLSDKTDVADVKKFVNDHLLPLVIPFSAEVAPKVFGGDVKKHVLLFTTEDGGKKKHDVQEKLDAMRESAKKFKGRALFLHIDADLSDNSRILEFFGVTSSDLPEIRGVVLGAELTKFKPENEDYSADYITEFVEKLVDGKLKAHLLSQEVPADWDKGNVKVLVAKNFDSVARDKSKAVFVEFYAPWCGHCKQLAPTWEQLGENYSGKDGVVIAKMDSTANELEDIKIQSFPTLKFFPRDSDLVVDYVGDRTLEAFKKFVDSNGKEGNKPPKDAHEEKPEEEEEEGEEEEVDEKKDKDEL